MSSETKVKRSASASNPPVDGDHRKRRRNRTTQSCLNCHTSKRMCDRKRPACARCTQLGLTGLCVYEIDDPSQRSDSQDETARLLKRVADLESIIREMKNKPHPRWSLSASNQANRLHSRPRLGGGIESQDLSSKGSSPRTPSESEESLTERPLTAKSSNTSPSIPILSSCRPSSCSQYCASSPQSTPSPSFLTPTEEYIHPHITTATQLDVSFDYDLSSMFLTYPNLVTTGGYRTFKTDRADERHCGCLHESINYSAALELSVQLRRAADILGRSPSHHIGSTCLLNQRITDLDTFTADTLGNMITSQEVSLMNQEGSRWNTGMLTSNQLYSPSPHRPSSKVWDVTDPDTPLPCGDTLMSWEPFRRAV